MTKKSKKNKNRKIKRTFRKKRQFGGDTTCSICLDKKADHCFVPCGHICICELCKKKLAISGKLSCPICRVKFTDIIKIYPVGNLHNSNESDPSLMPPLQPQRIKKNDPSPYEDFSRSPPMSPDSP